MTERNFGSGVQSWIGIVTNVNDPHQGGRVQVRIFGRHDDVANIPDADLPWAQVLQPVTSAARGRIGTAPVGMIVGSRVYGNWFDADHQYPLITGTLGRAGAPIPGQTDGGAPAVNTALGSIPGATQNDVNNPYSSLAPTRLIITDIDSNSTDVDAVPLGDGVVVTSAVEEGMQFATLPTTAAADTNETDILAILQQVDPASALSALPCLQTNAIQISLSIDLSSIAAGFINMLTDAVTRTLLGLMDQLGINNILNAIDAAGAALDNFTDALNALQSGGLCAAPAALNSISAGTQALAKSVSQIKTAAAKVGNAPQNIRTVLQKESEILSRVATSAFVPVSLVVTVPTGYVQEYYGYDSDPYPGYIRWIDPTGSGSSVFTARNGQPNYISAAQHTSYDVGSSLQKDLGQSIRTGSLNTNSLQNALTQATGLGQASALLRTIGANNPAQTLLLAAKLLPSLYSTVTGIFNVGISVSILPNAGAIQQSVNKFTQAQSILATRRARMENAFRRL
jgi:hypothetical protein